MTSRAWAFTLNNYTESEYENICTFECKYLIVGKEVGDSGTPHLQGFIRFEKPCRMTKVKQLMPRAHIEKAAGNDKQNIAYCSKSDETPFIKGESSSQGARTDLSEFAKDIKENGYDNAFLNSPEMGIRYHRGAREYQRLLRSKQIRPLPIIHWYHGPAGSGKTRAAMDQAIDLAENDMSQIWLSNGTLKWFDGYNGQPYVILDEFRKEKEISLSFILRLLDRYPFMVPVKGGYENWTPTRIFITSPKSPLDFRTDEEIKQITRRIDKIVEFNIDTHESDLVNDMGDPCPL